MGTKEMSDLFDVLYNNITSNQAPALNEYEKSVFLTKAQDELVKNYFLPQSNPKQAGFDDNQKRQIDFSKLIRYDTIVLEENNRGTVDPRGFKVMFQDDIMFIINENVQYLTDHDELKGIRQVVPLKYSEYSARMSKPFKEPTKNQAWRLIVNMANVTNDYKTIAEIILTSADVNKYIKSSATTYASYTMRYVVQPTPIILVNLNEAFGEDLTIHGKQNETPCMLDASIHEEIVQRAVELAKVAWTATGNDNVQAVIQAGQRSE